jgi:hypothetical protein
MGDSYGTDEHSVAEELARLIGPLSDDEVALVCALTPSDLNCTDMVEHMFDLVDMVAAVRGDEAIAEYVYAIAPMWDGSIEALLLAGRVTTACAAHELALVS